MALEKSLVSISGRIKDMGGNPEVATRHNLELELVSDRCTLLGIPAQEMTFPDGSFDVIVSNLCLHNIYDRKLRRQALQRIVRVLKPGGAAILSDYKLTAEYVGQLRQAGLMVQRRWVIPSTPFRPYASSSPASLSYPCDRGVRASLSAGPLAFRGPDVP